MIGILLTEEVNHKNNEGSQSGNVLTVKRRSMKKGKAQESSRSRSKTYCSLKDIECNHRDKKRHLKKNCRLFKKENGKGKDKGKKKAKEESNVKIEKVNTLSGDNGNEERDILRASIVELSTLFTTNDILVHD